MDGRLAYGLYRHSHYNGITYQTSLPVLPSYDVWHTSYDRIQPPERVLTLSSAWNRRPAQTIVRPFHPSRAFKLPTKIRPPVWKGMARISRQPTQGSPLQLPSYRTTIKRQSVILILTSNHIKVVRVDGHIVIPSYGARNGADRYRGFRQGRNLEILYHHDAGRNVGGARSTASP